MSLIELLRPCKTHEDGFAAGQSWAEGAEQKLVAEIAQIPADHLQHPRLDLVTEEDPEEFFDFVYDEDLTREALIGFVAGVRAYYERRSA